jgi:hypothetical protein
VHKQTCAGIVMLGSELTVRNPQEVNIILERTPQTMGNIIHTFEIEDRKLDESDPWSGILSAAIFAARATAHSTLNATPSQLVCG